LTLVPVAAKQGGGQSPSTVTIVGDVTYIDGPAKVHDSKRYFSLTIGVEGKNKLVEYLSYSSDWPGEFSDGVLDSSKSFFSIHYEWDGSYDVITCSLDERWVLKAYGDYTFDTNSVSISIDPDGSGHIDYYERVKREGLVLVTPIPNWDLIEFTVTFG
jgi:hypothetical protein